MIAIGEWLKQIILIVILAVFTELLLPTKAMQKYVRVVMGLVVIATMLEPILPYFQRDWADKLAASAASEIVGNNNNSTKNLATAAGLTNYQANLQQEQTTATNQYVAEQLRTQIAAQFHCVVSQLTVQGAIGGTAPMEVQVSLPLFSPTKLGAVQNFVATTLKIPLNQVSVRSD